MKYVISTVIYIALFFGAGFLLLNLFSKLTGIEMFSAMSWGFKAKRFELVLTSIMFYLIAYVMLFAIIIGPLFTITASTTQKGGLLGYMGNDYNYKYYDPAQGQYVEIKHYDAPPAAEKLNETFTIVSFYKPLFVEHYQNIFEMSLPISLIKIFVFFIGAIPLYLVLHALANEFNKHNGMPQTITHKLIKGNFSEITGFNLITVIWIILFIIIIITVVQYFVSKNITDEHKRVFGEYSNEYRRRIKDSVSPGDKVAGSIIRREKTSVKKYIHHYNDDEKFGESDAVYTPVKIYTIEFSDILSIPVYINLRVEGDAETNPNIGRIDSLFPDKKSELPIEKKEIEFIVNHDYSVSLPNADF